MKTLLRSFLLWIVIVLALFIVMNYASSVNSSYTLVENGLPVKQVLDTDPDYVLIKNVYIQTYINCAISWVLLYVIPVLCVVSVMIVLTRDYSDNFFEIQKSNGEKAYSHYLGQLTAILTINILLYLIVTYIATNYYYFSRGGVEELTIIEYLLDNITRIIRMFVTSALPTIILYTTLTYFLCCLFKSGFAGGVLSLGYVLFVYSSKSILRTRLPNEYHLYFSPISSVPYRYWGLYGTEWFYEEAGQNPYTANQVLLWLGIMVGSIVLYGVITYFYTKKRTT